MNKFKLFTFWIIFMELLLIIFINVHILGENQGSTGRLYLVESKRIRKEIEEQNVTKHQIETMDLGKYETIVGIREFVAGENGRYDYLVEEIDGTLYRMEYVTEKNNRMSIYVNLSLFGMVFVTMMVLWYVHHKILKPFWNMSDLSFESAKGNLSMPVKEEKTFKQGLPTAIAFDVVRVGDAYGAGDEFMDADNLATILIDNNISGLFRICKR